ncbi:MAG TPA: c-type cytochrome [Polyangiaceae bacterium]|jgi:mono/diheme cytochrome c family protein
MTPSRASLRISLLLALALTLGCTAQVSAPNESEPFLSDRAYRRHELELSLVNPSDGYARVRLAHYATGTASDWDQLPEWNPETALVSAEFLATGSADSNAAPSALELPDASDEDALRAFGKLAFSRFPAQLAPYLSVALSSPAAATGYGLWVDEARGVGGLVQTRLANGSMALALTCSSCHAARTTRGVEDGFPNAALDLGAAIVAAPGSTLAPETAAHFAAWGPGRLDVTTSSGLEPARIADLRATRFQTNLQQDATLSMRGETTLAIRIETLLITSSGQVVRPARVVALALAAYVDSLSEALPSDAAAAAAAPPGARIFEATCASCHSSPTLSGPAVPLELIGTDETLGLSSERGTGMYRVPSLHGVATRGPLLHDGSLPSLAAMFDPARETSAFAQRLHGTGAVPGHRFGLDLSEAERAALVAYLGLL